MKIKKLLSFILSVMLILSAVPIGLFSITAGAETATSGTTGDCTWTLDGTVLTISGNGAMENYWYSDSLPWGISITEVIINTGVTSIGDNAFKSCASLTSITIPDSVTNIFGDAFSGCTGLTSIRIPDGVTSIDQAAFYGCTNLKEVHINDIAKWCSIKFSNYSSNPLSYAYCLYLNDELITNLVIPKGVADIGDYAFINCSGLTSIIIPGSVTSIGRDAFSGCSKLENLTINGAERLYENSFSNCNSLKNIYLSKNLKTVYNRAFGGIKSIENIYYEGSEEEWNAVTILPNNDALKKANVYFNSTGIPDEVPTAPELLRNTACTVTLKHTDGYEYRLNDGEWQSSNIFTGLNPNTEYKFYCRTVAADESPAGTVSYALTVITSEIIRGDINDDREVNILDLICLKKFFADPLNNVVPAECLDVSGDGRINSKDLAALRKNLLLQ